MHPCYHEFIVRFLESRKKSFRNPFCPSIKSAQEVKRQYNALVNTQSATTILLKCDAAAGSGIHNCKQPAAKGIEDYFLHASIYIYIYIYIYMCVCVCVCVRRYVRMRVRTYAGRQAGRQAGGRAGGRAGRHNCIATSMDACMYTCRHVSK